GAASIGHLSQAEDVDLDYQTAMSDSFPRDETDSDGKLASYRGLYDLSTLEGQEGETAKAVDGIDPTEARLFMVDETTSKHEKSQERIPISGGWRNQKTKARRIMRPWWMIRNTTAPRKRWSINIS
ncbi:hypothetical protein OXX79_014526, partial [Metschnikowia pulcherrima]